MPVAGMVQYDCNVSMKEQAFGPSTTIIVELPDGMEKYPSALEDALFKGVLKRLKVVAYEVRESVPRSPLTTYHIQISTDRGFNFGNLKMTAPHSTGWWDGNQVNLAENYFPSEIEGYIEQTLRRHLSLRLNQRMPPLPRSEPDEKGQRPDLLSTPLFPDEREFEELKTKIKDSVLRRSDSFIFAEARRRQHEDVMFRRRQEELIRRNLMGMEMRPVAPEDLPFPGTEDGRDVAALPFPGSAYAPKDVSRRSSDSSRVDTASRGGTQGQDVAEMGVELDL